MQQRRLVRGSLTIAPNRAAMADGHRAGSALSLRIGSATAG